MIHVYPNSVAKLSEQNVALVLTQEMGGNNLGAI